MTIPSVQNQSSASYSTAAANQAQGYDTNMFMQVILAQLQHQNPMEPLKDAELMSQFTQLNSLSELQAISRSIAETASAFQTGYASSLIGKTVTAARPNGSSLEGEVTSIIVERQRVFLLVGEEKVPLENVTRITETKQVDPSNADDQSNDLPNAINPL